MRYLGNCVDSFDENGDCLIIELGWKDVSEFACEEENSEILEGTEIPSLSELPDEGIFCVREKNGNWLETPNGVLMFYDYDSDVHHFFLRIENKHNFR